MGIGEAGVTAAGSVLRLLEAGLCVGSGVGASSSTRGFSVETKATFHVKGSGCGARRTC